MKTTFRFYSFLFIFSSFVSFQCFSQAPEIEWENTLGTSLTDYFSIVIPTFDGGFLLGGSTNAGFSGDKTEGHIGAGTYYYDIWIIKLNSSGEIEWQNTIGATYEDWLSDICQTADGGYMLAGYSNSHIGYDKTEDVIGGGSWFDCWMIKIDSIGQVLWDNVIGGTTEDYFSEVIPTSDEGFLFLAKSRSDVSGDKTESLIGAYDYWVIKTNAEGIIEWQNTIGGDAIDHPTDLIQTIDGGYLIAGYSMSGAFGDKSESSNGLNDYWLVKINSIGEIEWENTIGGDNDDFLEAVIQNPDGTYIIGGNSYSGISGDKTDGLIGILSDDCWILKLDVSGNIIWQNSIGGKSTDYLKSLKLMGDGNILVGATSASDPCATCDITEEPVGNIDYWVFKIDQSGNILWQNTIGGSGYDKLLSVDQCPDGSFILGGQSNSAASGDKSEGYWLDDVDDFWIVKLFPDCFPIDETCNSLDDNCNGLIDEDVIESCSISAAGPTTFCNGGSVVLSAIYSGETIQWKKNGFAIPGATTSSYTANSKGFYTCETYSSCDTITSSSIFVNTIKGPPASITAGGPTTFCDGGSVVLTANPGVGLSYQWYKGGTPLAGATSINYTATIAGNFKCKVTKAFTGCYKFSNVISVSVPCKGGEWSMVNGESGFTLYPNPANEILFISINELTNHDSPLLTHHSSLIITDVQGKEIFRSEINSLTTEINISDFASGMYFVEVKIDETEVIEKFIKN